jgi:hypothetical protein
MKKNYQTIEYADVELQKGTNGFTFRPLVESLQEIIRYQSSQSTLEFGPYNSHEADTRYLIFPILDKTEYLIILGEAMASDTSQFSVRVRHRTPHNFQSG